jgi:hypothetical protein
MLVTETSGTDEPTRKSRPASAGVILLLALVALIVFILRHDYWNWDTPYPLLFGFLPVGLWWQGVVSILAAVMMWMMVKFAWPQHLEDEAIATDHERRTP